MITDMGVNRDDVGTRGKEMYERDITWKLALPGMLKRDRYHHESIKVVHQ